MQNLLELTLNWFYYSLLWTEIENPILGIVKSILLFVDN